MSSPSASQPALAGDILLEVSPGAPALRISVNELLDAAQDTLNQPFQPQARGSEPGEDPPAPPAAPGSPVPSEPQIDDDVDISLLLGQECDNDGGSADDGAGGADDAQAAEAAAAFQEFLSTMGASEALAEVERMYGGHAAVQLGQQLLEAAAAEVLLDEDATDAADADSGDDDDSNGRPGTSKFYRDNLTKPLHPETDMTLLQWLTLLLRWRAQHRIPDEVRGGCGCSTACPGHVC